MNPLAGARQRRRAVAAGAAVTIALLTGGCALKDALSRSKSSAMYCLSFHEFASDGMASGNMIRTVTDAAGRQRFRVRHIPILSSRQITTAEVVDTGEGRRPVLKLQLDHHGAMRWMQACRQMPDDRLAVLVDGFYACPIRVPHGADRAGTISLTGPWSPAEAAAIAEHAASNYKKLNGTF